MELNSLLDDRKNHNIGSQSHKDITKKIKKRVKKLRNEKLAREADEINNFANKRQIEELLKV